MWILLIVLSFNHGITSEQLFFDTEQECARIADLTQRKWRGAWGGIEASCLCIPISLSE